MDFNRFSFRELCNPDVTTHCTVERNQIQWSSEEREIFIKHSTNISVIDRMEHVNGTVAK